MMVRALKSFSSVGPHGRRHFPAGAEFELPDGVDWLKAGLVEPVGKPAAATRKTAVSKQTKGRSTRAKTNTDS